MLQTEAMFILEEETKKFCEVFIEDNFNEYDSFEELYEDMEKEVSGSLIGRSPIHNDEVIEALIWDADFISFIEEFSTCICTIVKRGKEASMVMLVYWYMDYYFNYQKAKQFYESLVGEM